MSSASTALPFAPGPSSTHGSPSKRGSDRNAAQPASPISPSPRFAWRSRLEPSAGHRVVDVQRAEPVDPEARVELVQHARRASPRRGCRSPTRTDGRSPGRSRAARRRRQLDQPRELLERAAQRPARAGGVLEVQRAVLGLLQRLDDHLAAALQRRSDLAVFSAEPGCSTTPRAPSAAPMRNDVVSDGQRLLAEVRVLGRRIEQVDGVDQQRVDVRARPSPRGTRRPARRRIRAAPTGAGSG